MIVISQWFRAFTIPNNNPYNQYKSSSKINKQARDSKTKDSNRF